MFMNILGMFMNISVMFMNITFVNITTCPTPWMKANKERLGSFRNVHHMVVVNPYARLDEEYSCNSCTAIKKRL